MALIAALFRDADERGAFAAALDAHELAMAGSWKGLDRLVRARPAAALVVVEPYAEPRKDGALHVFRFVERYPETPLIAWGVRDPRKLFRLGKACASDVVPAPHTRNAERVRELVERALAPDLATLLTDRLHGRIPDAALDLLRTAASPADGTLRVPRLAARRGVSVSTLERRCERCGAPPPGRILLWTRVLRALMWLREPGRSVESVARRLGYSSGAALSRAVRSVVGSPPAGLRGRPGLDAAFERFAAEFDRAAPAVARRRASGPRRSGREAR